LTGNKKTWNLSNQQELSEYNSLCQNGIWIEGIAYSAAERDVSFALRYKLNDRLLITHAVKATVVMINLGNVVGREVDNDALAERGHTAIVGRYDGECTKSNMTNAM